MTITAKNYAASALHDMRAITRALISDDSFRRDITNIRMLGGIIENAQHFSLPDGGRILDAKMKGLYGRDLRLPYQYTTIEYYQEEPDGEFPNNLILAAEFPLEEYESVRKVFPDMESGDIFILVSFMSRVNAYDSRHEEMSERGRRFYHGKWYPSPFAWVMPSKNLWGERREDSVGIRCRPIPLLPDTICRRYGLSEQEMLDLMALTPHSQPTNEMESDMIEILQSMQTYCYSVFELCEALTCSNIKAEVREKISPKVQRKREKKGKMPLFETKILTVDMEGKMSGKGEYQGGTHASPRQHLRRGHIRRYQSGLQIWVNSCVVGSDTNGKIDKRYKLI